MFLCVRQDEWEEGRDTSVNCWVFASAVIAPWNDSNMNVVVDQWATGISLASITSIFTWAQVSVEDYFFVINSLAFFVRQGRLDNGLKNIWVESGSPFESSPSSQSCSTSRSNLEVWCWQWNWLNASAEDQGISNLQDNDVIGELIVIVFRMFDDGPCRVQSSIVYITFASKDLEVSQITITVKGLILINQEEIF